MWHPPSLCEMNASLLQLLCRSHLFPTYSKAPRWPPSKKCCRSTPLVETCFVCKWKCERSRANNANNVRTSHRNKHTRLLLLSGSEPEEHLGSMPQPKGAFVDRKVRIFNANYKRAQVLLFRVYSSVYMCGVAADSLFVVPFQFTGNLEKLTCLCSCFCFALHMQNIPLISSSTRQLIRQDSSLF